MGKTSRRQRPLRIGMIMAGIFIAGMVTTGIGVYVLMTQGGKLASRYLSNKLAPSQEAPPDLNSIASLVKNLPSGAAGASEGGDVSGAAGGLSTNTNPQDVSKMMDQLSPEAKQMVAKLMPNPEGLNSLVQEQSPTEPSESTTK